MIKARPWFNDSTKRIRKVEAIKKDRVASLREQFLNKNKKKVRVASRFSYSGEGNMELRRPRLADKETVLEMMADV